MSEILSQFKDFSNRIDSRLGEQESQLGRVLKRLDHVEGEATRRTEGGQDGGAEGILAAIRQDPAFQEYKSRNLRGRYSISLPGVPVPEFKTTITSATVGSSTPGILVPERIPGIVKPGVRSLRVRDLMTRVRISGNAVECVKENVFTNSTSPTAETISKPESALTFTIDSAPVRTLAAWIPASRQVIDDFDGLAEFLQVRLIEGLMDVEDYELVAGDGTGQHISGLSSEAAAYDTARNVSGDTYIDKLNHAIGQIEDASLQPDGIILHPRDWRAMQLTKTEEGGANTGTYLLGGPAGTAVPTLWGLPVATTTAVTRGTFYVGSFRRHCLIGDRMSARIEISTEHQDYFVRNMIALLAEERIAFLVTRSDAVVYGSF